MAASPRMAASPSSVNDKFRSSSSFCGTVQSSHTEIRQCRFTVADMPGPPKSCILIPKGRVLTKKDWPNILKAWKLTHPNLMIQMDSGGTHPRRLLNADLAECPEFKELLEKLNKAKASSADDTMHPEEDSSQVQLKEASDISSQVQLKEANDILYNKLVTIMEGVANAASQTNSWLVSSGSPSQGELLLEEALARSNANPVVLVVDQIDRAMCSEQFAPAQKFLSEIYDELSSEAVPLGSERAPTTVEVKSDLWDPSVNTTSEHFTNMAKLNQSPFAMWEFNIHNDAEAKGHPWGAGFYRSGTHYVFFENVRVESEQVSDDSPRLHPEGLLSHQKLMQMTNLSCLGSMGYVFMGGGDDVRRHVLFAIQNAMPTIIVHNTGRAAQQWAIIMQQIKKAMLMTPEDPDRSSDLLALRLMQAVHKNFPLVGNLKEIVQVTTPDIWAVLDVFKGRPEVFKDTIAVVNPLQDSPERVLNALSSSFASQVTGAAELGVGTAQAEVILEAWRIHALLDHNARRQKFSSNGLFFSSVFLSFFTTAVSVTITVGEARGGSEIRSAVSDVLWHSLKVSCLILPAIAGIVTSAMARFRVGAKSSVLTTTAARVVTEIYSFRTRTGSYNSLKFASTQDEDDDVDSGMMVARLARMHFVRSIQGLLNSVTNSDMIGDHLVEVPDPGFEVGSQALKEHVARTVLKVDSRVLNSIVGHPAPGKLTTPLLQQDSGFDTDDMVSPISTEAYMDYRVVPMLARLKNQSPSISKKMHLIEMLIFILATIATLLAAFEYREWIPVAVALSTVLSSSLQFLGLQAHLEATNVGIGQIQNLITLWRGMGVVDRRMPGVRELLVSTLEAVALAEVTSVNSKTGIISGAATDHEQREAMESEKKKATPKNHE